MGALTEQELMYRERLITHGKNKILRFLESHGIPFKYRLIMYLATPKVCYSSWAIIPTFHKWEAKHGEIIWKEDFPYLLRDQAVNLVRMCKYAVNGNYTYFPFSWTKEMIFDFVKECVDMGLHEFDYCA